MIRQVRLVLSVAAIVALLLVVEVILLVNPLETEEESGMTFKAVEPVDVQSVLINNAYGSFDIAFTGEGYQVDDIPADLVDMEEFLTLLTNCGKVYASQTVATAPQDLTLYGLEAPAARVHITYVAESELTLLVGNVEQVTGDRYFSVEGDPGVYLMDSERGAGFLLPKKAFVEDLK